MTDPMRICDCAGTGRRPGSVSADAPLGGSGTACRCALVDQAAQAVWQRIRRELHDSGLLRVERWEDLPEPARERQRRAAATALCAVLGGGELPYERTRDVEQAVQ